MAAGSAEAQGGIKVQVVRKARRPSMRHGSMLALVSVLALSACEMSSGPFASRPAADADGAALASAGEDAKPARTQRSTRIVERDVEAPSVFQVSDTALWDGRPSLGGVWVASPDTKDPERVIMRNPANGKFVIGALFRRERENPGPKLQISSDAAEALGLLAGQPGRISVTALRREEVPESTPATPILDTAEPLKTAPGAPGAAAQGVPAVTATALPGPTSGPVTAGSVTAVPARAAPVAAPVKPAAVATPTAAKPAAAPASKPVAKPAAGGERTIQIGIFSVKANAERAVATLGKAGISAQLRDGSAQGKSFWQVTARGDGATLKKVQSAGFADAYIMK